VDTLLRVGLSNAVAACVLAVVAGAVGYFCRRPAVRHALWLLVLLKLVTPPLIDIPVWHPAPAEASALLAEPATPPDDAPELAVIVQPSPAEDEARGEEPVARQDEVVAALPPVPEDEPAAPPPDEPRMARAGPPALAWRPLAAAVWLGGAALYLLVAGLRARRFARLLHYARPAPPWLQTEVIDLALRLGLPRAPLLSLVPGRVSPMVWSPGWAARLLLPAELLSRLDDAGRRTLLAHELAHLRRGDHRVRLFELLVTALFWWHPVVWWARRELREAEELCCDAWVLWAIPEAAKPYALALVETVDFLSESPAALPALASGMGHVHDLRRRVTMIMQGTTPRALTWGGVLALLGLGSFLLPVAPSWAQEEGQPAQYRLVQPGAEAPKVADEVQALKAEVERLRAQLARDEAALKGAQERLTKAAAGQKGTEERHVIVLEIVDGDKREVIKLPAGSRVIRDQPANAKEPQPKAANDALKGAEMKLRFLTDELKKKEEAAKAQGKATKRLVIEIVSDGKRQVIELPPGSRVINEAEVPKVPEIRWEVKPGQPGQPLPVMPGRFEVKPDDGGYKAVVRPPTAATEKRIADLEKRLEELMRSVKELRGELNKERPNAPKAPTPPGAPGRVGTPREPQQQNNLLVPVPPAPPAPVQPEKR
jgi:beta-lactamase regulating signal transducer with metallopeptidase domain